MRVHFTPEFRRDLRKLKHYLNEQGFHNADKVGKEILTECSDLKNFPHKGKSAYERFGIETDMKYLILGQNLIFYRINAGFVEIIRLFDTRSNIAFRMFGIDIKDPESEEFWGE